jgi:hypothetical protein
MKVVLIAGKRAKEERYALFVKTKLKKPYQGIN